MKSILFLFLLIAPFLNGLSQENVFVGILPSINVNKKLEKDYFLNGRVESRQTLFNSGFNYNYDLTDLVVIGGKKLSVNKGVAAGYLFRVEEGVIYHRATQQFTYIQRIPAIILAHRLSTDQTFSGRDLPEFRFRYRIASEIPLQGQSLDEKEFFIKLSNEYLNGFQSKQYDLEIRALAFLGYEFNSQQKVEFGIDYRIDSFVGDRAEHVIWLGLNFFHSF